MNKIKTDYNKNCMMRKVEGNLAKLALSSPSSKEYC